ncbi:SAM-dependent methyltransferase [Amycolatopsis lurida]
MSTEDLRRRARDFNLAFSRPPSVSTPEEVGEFYDKNNRVITEIYGGNMHYGYWTGPDDDSGFSAAGARLTDIMIGKLAVEPGWRVLDLGCGTGGPGIRLAKATGAHVVGISISTADVEQANSRARDEGVADRAEFRHANAIDLPFDAESFDAVLALESIVHIPDRRHVLGQIARVLRPGGRLALTDFVSFEPEKGTAEDKLAVTEMLAAWRAAPLVRAGDYHHFAAATGLVVDEIVDITENTKYTFAKTYAALRAYARRHGELPPDMAHIFAMGAEVDWAAEDDTPPGEGVVIVVAHRPGARA